MKTTVKQIFDYISGMNPTVSTISSMGSFVSSFNGQVADGIKNEVVTSLNEGSVAYKIATTSLAANKANSQSVLDYIKESGRLLKDYYAFVKASKLYKKEFFSKKFTMASAEAFLAI